MGLLKFNWVEWATLALARPCIDNELIQIYIAVYLRGDLVHLNFKTKPDRKRDRLHKSHYLHLRLEDV